MSESLDVASANTETLYALRRHVEDADAEWYAALDRGEPGKSEGQTFKATLREYRDYEAFCLSSGLTESCGRCGGKGVVDYGRVVLTATRRDGSTVQDRFCFQCGGSKVQRVRKHKFDAQAPTRFKRQREFEAKQAAAQADGDEKWSAFTREHPAEADVLYRAHWDTHHLDYSEWDRGVEFLTGLYENVRKYGSLTDKQLACVTREVEKRAEQAAAVEFPEGLTEVEGEIVSLPQTRGYAGSTKTNMLVKLTSHRGNKVMGTIPEKVWRAMESDEQGTNHGRMVGSKVRFTATFTKSDRDEHFGFYKSPKGVEVTHVARHNDNEG